MSSVTTCCPSYRYSVAEETEREGTVIVARKIKLKLSKEQKKKVRMFADHARYTYNAAVQQINEDKKANKMKLRNQLVTYKNNEYFQDKEWLLRTPKVIRQQAVFEAAKNFKSAMTNLSRRNTSHFKLDFKSRKKYTTWSIGIERAAKRVDSGDKKRKKLSILPETLGECGYYGELPFDCQVPADSTLHKDGRGRYFLVVTITRQKKSIDVDSDIKPIIALDPGVRKFMTGFSSNNSAIILGEGFGKRLLTMLEAVDTVDSEMSKANSASRKKLRKKKMRMLGRIKDLRDEFQWKIINYLTTEYSCIILPHLQTQQLSQQPRAKVANREMNVLGHYQFLQRLKYKCHERNVAFLSIKEDYTSKTCGNCGELNDIGSSERYACQRCGFCADRDVQAARNIFIKTIITESCLHFEEKC
jgi:transposase